MLLVLLPALLHVGAVWSQNAGGPEDPGFVLSAVRVHRQDITHASNSVLFLTPPGTSNIDWFTCGSFPCFGNQWVIALEAEHLKPSEISWLGCITFARCRTWCFQADSPELFARVASISARFLAIESFSMTFPSVSGVSHGNWPLLSTNRSSAATSRDLLSGRPDGGDRNVCKEVDSNPRGTMRYWMHLARTDHHGDCTAGGAWSAPSPQRKILSVPTQQGKKQGIRRTKRPFTLVIIIHMHSTCSHEHNSKDVHNYGTPRPSFNHLMRPRQPCVCLSSRFHHPA